MGWDMAGRGRKDFVLVVRGETKDVNEHERIIYKSRGENRTIKKENQRKHLDFSFSLLIT